MSSDYGSPEFDDEGGLQAYLAEQFEQRGWGVKREVRPDNSQYRVDLLLSHPVFGRVGIETKFMRQGDGGGIVAEAHEQITQQYWDEEYGGEKVLLWALCPYSARQRSRDGFGESRAGVKKGFIREFFCHYGIGFLDLWTPASLITYNYSDTEMKIPAFPNSGGIDLSRYDDVSIDAIREAVAKKRGVDKNNYQ